MIQLTIAIPTFNRNTILYDNISILLPQLTENCKLVIIDNNSDIPVKDTISDLVKYQAAVEIDIVTNRINIGANPNILRCFEVCDSEWIWVLGDDDKVMPNAINLIFSTIREHSHCIFINFSSGIYKRDVNFLTRGTAEFIEKLDSFSNALFISAGIFKADIIKSNIKLGYFYAYSMAPHFATLLATIGQEGQCYFSTSQLVNWEPPEVGQRWSFLNLGLGIMTIVELVRDVDMRRILARKILKDVPSIEYYFYQLLWLAAKQKESDYAMFLYDQIFYRLFYYSKWNKIKYYLIRLLLLYPNLTYKALFTFKKMRGYDLEKRMYDNIYSRI